MPESGRCEGVKTWAAIETQADMVFNSFAYERITWKTADPAREETHQKLQGFFATGMLINVAAAMDLPELFSDESWMKDCLGPAAATAD